MPPLCRVCRPKATHAFFAVQTKGRLKNVFHPFSDGLKIRNAVIPAQAGILFDVKKLL